MARAESVDADFGWSVWEDIDKSYHIIPQHGPDHMLNKFCWCEPDLDFENEENGKCVWIHKQIH